jgi:hypothetical protein
VDLGQDAEPRRIERLSFATIDVEDLARDINLAAEQAARARQAAEARHSLAIGLRQDAERLEQEHPAVSELAQAANTAAELAEQARVANEGLVREAEETAALWLQEVRIWTDARPESSVVLAPIVELPSAQALADDAVVAEETRAALRRRCAPAVADAHNRAAALKAEMGAAEAERTSCAEELAMRRNGVDIPPPPHRYRSSDRPLTGAAFYQLVEFSPDLPQQSRAGLEAAMQASGLLDAWVNEDGSILDPDLHDVVAIGSSAPMRTLRRRLADLVVPAATDLPVADGVIATLLQSIAVTEDPAAVADDGLVLSLSGRWRSGNLTGAWSKDTAEYVGADARTAHRHRRITELLSQLEALDEAIAAGRINIDAAMKQVDDWDQYLEECPSTAAMAASRATVSAAADRLENTEGDAQVAISKHADANGRWQAAHSEFSRRATNLALPVTMPAIVDRIGELSQAITTVTTLATCLTGRCRAALTEIGEALSAHERAVGVREDAEQEASGLHRKFATAAKALALHLETLGADATEHDRRLQELKATLKSIQENLPELRRKFQVAHDRALTLGVQQTDARTSEEEKRRELAQAEQDFERVLHIAGVWAAASSLEPSPQTMAEALAIAGQWPTEVDEKTQLDAIQSLRASLPGSHNSEVSRTDGVYTVLVNDGEGLLPVAEAATRAAERLAGYRAQLDKRYRSIFEEYLLRDLAEHLRKQIDLADSLCQRMNAILSTAQSSQGVTVELTWSPSPALDEATREALGLVRSSLATRTPAQDAQLRRALQERIEAERDDRNAYYGEVLAHALDYRNWYSFTVHVRDTGPDGRERRRLLSRLSSGETRLVSYVTLFAAAAAFYDALTAPGAMPLRLVLLDEAFERLDDPTITRLLELLVKLDMDWVITWPGGSAFSPQIRTMQVYDVLRPKGAPGIGFVHTTWDGAGTDDD